MRIVAGFTICIALAWSTPASPAECPGNPNAIGVSRTLKIDTARGGKFGTYQYQGTLDLAPKEVVLTFDDGPNPAITPRIAAALKAECVKATFFVIGAWAKQHPEILRSLAQAGHGIANHSWSHPSNLGELSYAAAADQIERGFASIAQATGAPVTPFFRFPGLNDSSALTAYAASRGYAVFSCDIGTDDWRGISAAEIISRTLARLEQKGRGIILFHDTKQATAEALPVLLRELKIHGYKVVHVVAEKPYAPGPEAIAVAKPQEPIKARVLTAGHPAAKRPARLR